MSDEEAAKGGKVITRAIRLAIMICRSCGRSRNPYNARCLHCLSPEPPKPK